MTPENKQFLFDLCRVQSCSHENENMIIFLCDWCENNGISYDIDDHGNMYLIKGESETYPCLVAHLDTVHDIIKNGEIEVVEMYGAITGFCPQTMTQTGIGGDDKCGIYAALYCLQNLPAAKVAFFVDEEIGCCGSKVANLDFFKDCRFVLQADRRGNSDFVNDISGPISSKAFQDAVFPIINSHGYSFTTGMMTDVQELRNRNVGISVANMSAAYFNPHSKNEYIVLDDLDNVCSMMLEICEQITDVYPFTYERPKNFYTPGSPTYRGGSMGGHGRDYRDWNDYWRNNTPAHYQRGGSDIVVEEEDDQFDENGIPHYISKKYTSPTDQDVEEVLAQEADKHWSEV